jgi:succinyl-CoA synthetase alpha subunit
MTNNGFNIFDILIGKEIDRDYKKKPVIIQGITGKYGSTHTRLMKAYGTNIVAGVTPGKGGQEFEGIPVYNNVSEAVEVSGAKISGVFVPAPFFLDAAKDALDNGIKLLVAIPEHVPIKDSLEALEYARSRDAKIIGPNTSGLIVPEVMKIGVMPPQPFKSGKTAVFSRSGTLMFEISYYLTKAGYGQKLCLGIGGDHINGTNLIEAFNMVKDSQNVESIVVIGEIGGDSEEQLANYLMKIGSTKPVVAYIAGRSAPGEKRMGHAGAVIYGEYGSAESKVSNFAKADIPVAKSAPEIPKLLAKKLQKLE